MARLRLSEHELTTLRTCLTSTLAGAVIPDWEFATLFGCSRGSAARSLEAAIRRIEQRQERPNIAAYERMMLLLSALLGASAQARIVRGTNVSADDLEALIERLGSEDHAERSPLESGIALRADAARSAKIRQR